MADKKNPPSVSQQEHDLRHKPIGPLLMQLAIPAIVAQLVNALYNIVDRIYIGNIPEQGGLLLTGVGVTFAIIILINACTALIGAGGAPILSMHLGRGEHQEASMILNESFVYLILFSLILMPLILLTQNKTLYWFGASDQTFPHAKNYLTIYSFGTPFVMISLGMNYFINAQGLARQGMISVLIGAITNIILDPIFIFALDLNVKGAALATVISQACSALYAIYILTRQTTAVRLDLSTLLQTRGQHLAAITALGVSPFIMQATEGILQLVQNSTLQRYGGDQAVGAMIIFGSLTQFIMLPAAGLTQGAQAITSYNFGAGLMDRVKKNIKYVTLICTAWLGGCWLLVTLFPGFFIGIFNRDTTMLTYAKPLLRIYVGGFLVSSFQISFQNSFVALGQAKISSFLAIVRKGVLLIPLILILPIWLGAKGVFIARPVADILAALTTAIFFLKLFPKLIAEQKAALRT